MEIKGTMLVDYIRMIRANKDKNWDKWLTDEDRQIVNQTVLPSSWYPYQTFSNIGFATFKELANSDMKTAKTFGRMAMKNLLKLYQHILMPDDPVSSVKKYANLNRVLVRGGYDSKIIDEGDNWFKYKWNFAEEDEEEERKQAYLNQTTGMFEELMEQSGAKNIKIENEREGEFFILKVSWE